MNDTVYKLQQRVEAWSTEAEVYQEGTNRVNVDIPGVYDAEKILSELGNPGSISFCEAKSDAATGKEVLDGYCCLLYTSADRMTRHGEQALKASYCRQKP